MDPAQRKKLDNGLAEPSDFIHGRLYKHFGGDVVSFNDPSWCVRPTRGSRQSVNFGDLPKWLIRPAKLTIAHGWLREGKSASWLVSGASSFRRIGEWLEDFNGASMAELVDEHSVILQLRLAEELTRYHDTLEQASLTLGRRLSFRETKENCRASHLLGPKSVARLVSMFNSAAILTEEIDGLAVPVRLKTPRAMSQTESARGIGSADPRKVLSSQQIAELERALGRDLRRYEKARALIQRELGQLDLKNFENERPSPAFDLERYFGINGFREHTAPEIAALRGLSPHTYPDVPRRIKRFLSSRIGPELAADVVSLRSQFPNLRVQKRFSEISALREYIHGVLSKSDLFVRDQKALCLEMYFGLNGCRVHSQVAIQKQLGLMTRRSITHNIHTRLTSIVGERKAKRILAVRERLRYYLSRAIKAQCLRLQLGVARRITAVLDLPVEPKMKVHMAEARRIVEIQFQARKTWGDEGVSEWVPCIDTFGEIAEDAIRVAQELTQSLREVAPNGIGDRLFIIPHNSFDSATPMTAKVLHEYIYTNGKGKDSGLLRRYCLDNLSHFEFHFIRQTHSTHMIEAGGTIQDVAHYLGHTSLGGSTNMAGAFYLAGGTDAMRERTADALRKGAATGLHFDGLARMKIEAMGSEAKNALVPPNQLSFEQARQRILSADIVESVPMEPAEAIQLAEQKTVFNVTRYGGCLLQATSGHCPTANPCPIGILPKGVEPLLGCGCKYLVLLPHSVEQLNKDIAIMEAQVTQMDGDKWEGWRSHTEAKLAHYRSLLQTAKSLNGSH